MWTYLCHEDLLVKASGVCLKLCMAAGPSAQCCCLSQPLIAGPESLQLKELKVGLLMDSLESSSLRRGLTRRG